MDYVQALAYVRLQGDTVTEYAQALEKMGVKKPSDENHCVKMVKDLLEGTVLEGNGCMILLRQPERTGLIIGEKLRQVRARLGLQRKFAIITDIVDGGDASLAVAVRDPNPEIYEDMRKRAGKEPVLETYEDLEGLPCILILCQKGKMGDSFPTSLKYYDLRLRYSSEPSSRAAVEQDLGRAFGYCDKEKAPPIILVGTGCMQRIKIRENVRGKSNKIGICSVHPDMKMECVCNPKKYPPEDQHFDTKVYRACWQTKRGHFDYGGKDKPRWIDNPRRFLLFGLPQIGKTGAYLHLLYLLWKAVKGSTEEENVSDCADTDIGTDSDSSDAETEDLSLIHI
eukprot:TRINITY_DN55588_c0_g2_i1.p1 TRINITY_DN55588_c0_g2~~TRINITY_DN55588_c0_g2_i1.p1  ORF type:complete len:339 (-),score=29.22 TRINITY_DN55588_c0_g2_i1:187-1203(-)